MTNPALTAARIEMRRSRRHHGGGESTIRTAVLIEENRVGKPQLGGAGHAAIECGRDTKIPAKRYHLNTGHRSEPRSIFV
jgi:hypothetical protein